MQIEIPVFVGSRLARWRRMVAGLTVAELFAKAGRRMSARVLPWYRGSLALAFHARSVLAREKAISVVMEGLSFSLAPQGAVAFDVWSRLRFERPELNFILSVLQPGITFFDIGANVGLFSLGVGVKLAGLPGAIYAFEPCPSTFAVLEKNLQQNRLANVRTFSVAVSDQSGQASLYVNNSLKDGLNSLERPSHTDAHVVGHVPVSTVTLDDFVETHGITRVDVMKVDVEGAELLVFRGARDLLRRPDAPLILYEGYSWCTAAFHYHPVEVIWLLEELGYEVFVLDSEAGGVRLRRPNEGYDAMVVAVKPTHARYRNVLQA